MERFRRNPLAIFVLVTPGLIIFFFAVLYPIFTSVYYGMSDWKGIGEINYIGLANFEKVIFHDDTFRKSLANAGLLAIATIVLQHPVALFCAILVDRISGKFETFMRAVFFIPAVISIVVTAKMWVSIYNYDYGLLNSVLRSLGLDMLTQDWLGDYRLAIFAVIFVIMWQGFGYAFLIYYSGIKGISEELYEAASIDGSNSRQKFWYITLPMLKPVILVNITLAIVSSLKQMEPIYLMTGGGPGSSTQFIANYLYVQAFNANKYGYANAISVVFVIVCLIITVILQRAFKEKQNN